jgi:hypothetical protein
VEVEMSEPNIVGHVDTIQGRGGPFQIRTYEWVGNRHKPVQVSEMMEREPGFQEVVDQLGLVKVDTMEPDPFATSLYCLSKPVALFWSGGFKLRRFFYILKVRILLTAQVWECARLTEGTVVRWADLKWPWK